MEPTLTRRVLRFEERRDRDALRPERLANSTEFLPPDFELIPRLLLLLDDPDMNCEAIAEVIRVDSGLTADVLRIANSACVAGMQRSESLPEAIIRIGLRQIYRVVTRVVASPAFNSDLALSASSVSLWRHSLAAAIAAEILARHLTKEDPEVIFSAALLHDLGKLVFLHALPDYVHLLDLCEQKGEPTLIHERIAFGADHAEVGAALLLKWKFPPRIVNAVEFHHEVESCEPAHARIAALISLGNVLAYRIGQGNGSRTYPLAPNGLALELLRLRSTDLPGYEIEVAEIFRREQERFW